MSPGVRTSRTASVNARPGGRTADLAGVDGHLEGVVVLDVAGGQAGDAQERLVGSVGKGAQLDRHRAAGTVRGLDDHRQLVARGEFVDLGHEVFDPVDPLSSRPHHRVPGVDEPVGRCAGNDVGHGCARAGDHVVAEVLQRDHDRGVLGVVHQLLVELLVLLGRLAAVDLIGGDEVDVGRQLGLQPLEPVDPVLADGHRGEEQVLTGGEGLGPLHADGGLGRAGRAGGDRVVRQLDDQGEEAGGHHEHTDRPDEPGPSGVPRRARSGWGEVRAGPRVGSPMSCPRWY